MPRPRRQPYPLISYLEEMKEGNIDNSADVQRKFVWRPEHINGLIRTVLVDDYIPPIILGEEESTKLHIVDGGQRSAALILFRYGNYKITKSIEDSVIYYKKKIRDEKGKIAFEDAEFDIKNKTYAMLPDELKKRFDKYVLEVVIHENCDRKQISKYVKIYNQQVTMNVAQKAYTYIYNFAENINCMLDSKFFTDCSSFTESEKNKGAAERAVLETVMCMFHIEKWKKQTKEISKFLNENSSDEEFEKLDDNLHKLENIITDDVKDLFNSKNSFIWLTLFDRFVSLGVDDSRFADFLRAFNGGLKNRAVDGQTFEEADKARNTKDKSIVLKKISILEALMKEFLNIDNSTDKSMKENGLEASKGKAISAASKEIIIECIDRNADDGDIELYEIIANDISESIEDIDADILSDENRPSFVAITAYAVQSEKEQALKEWIKKNYICMQFTGNQKENYLQMKEMFDRNSGSSKSA